MWALHHARSPPGSLLRTLDGLDESRAEQREAVMRGYLAILKYRNTVIRDTPNVDAISSAVNPCSRSDTARAGAAFVVPALRSRYFQRPWQP